MTRKDYILIASCLREVYEKSAHGKSAHIGGDRAVVSVCAMKLAREIKATNPSFDYDHFLAVVRGEKDANSKPERNLGIKTGTVEAEMFRHERNSQMGEAVREHLKTDRITVDRPSYNKHGERKSGGR